MSKKQMVIQFNEDDAEHIAEEVLENGNLDPFFIEKIGEDEDVIVYGLTNLDEE